VWAVAVIIASATCSFQFAEASAATLSQQEKNNSADVRRGRVNISGFISPTHPKILFEDGRIVLSRGHVLIVSAAIFAQVTGVGTMNEALNSQQMK
jgi:hypothetical protein